jgi:hypothetical protein
MYISWDNEEIFLVDQLENGGNILKMAQVATK